MRRACCLLLLVLVLLSTGCARYWVDRGRDAADIITVTGGMGAGAKLRVSLLNLGLVLHHEAGGLRGGQLYGGGLRGNGDMQLLIIGAETFVIYRGTAAEREKEINIGNFVVLPFPGACTAAAKLPPYYYSQVDLVGGAGLTGRLGVNPGELVDFVLGFWGIDIFGDDLETGGAGEVRNRHETPELQSRPRAFPQDEPDKKAP